MVIPITEHRHMLPMRGDDDQVFARFALRDELWLLLFVYLCLGVVPVWILAFALAGLSLLEGLALLPVLFSFFGLSILLLRHAVNWIRCATCGSDGLWILLQTYAGRSSLASAGFLYHQLRVPCEQRGAPIPDWLRETETRLNRRQVSLINDWLRSGKPYGP